MAATLTQMETAMITLTMRLTKLHKVLASYEQVDATNDIVKKPVVSSIYVRQSAFETMPEVLTVTLQPKV
jgi:hypothetical protein